VVARYARNVGERADLARMIRMARRALPELSDPFDLTRISCEVLVIWGTEDRLVSPAGARTISAHLPDARIEILEGCGHCPQVEVPADTARLLDEVAVQVAKAKGSRR
jgi:pimeloyl-ACP methyl ester carboxylesterase